MTRNPLIVLSEVDRANFLFRPLWKPILQSVANIAVFVVLAYIATIDSLWPLRIFVWPLMGLILAGFLQAAHDCFHNSFVNSKLANRIMGLVWCVPILTNFSAIKYAHLVHHRFTRVNGDSEPPFIVPTVKAYISVILSSVTTLPRALLKQSRILFGIWRPPHLSSKQAYRDVRIDSAAILVWAFATIFTTFMFPSFMFYVYWIPLAFFPPMVICIAMPEHHGCENGPEILASTRSTNSNLFVRMLIWNSNYHTEHHLFPAVPSCNLPRLHRAIGKNLKNYSSGYINYHFNMFRKMLGMRASKSPIT